jgi:hypothetical protein
MNTIENMKKRVAALAPGSGTDKNLTPEEQQRNDERIMKIYEAILAETLTAEQMAELQNQVDQYPPEPGDNPRVPRIVYRVIGDFLADGPGSELRYKELDELCKRHGIE